MNRRILMDGFSKMYPRISRRALEDLVNAVVGGKYWRGGDGIFCIALTRARYRDLKGRYCRCSGLGRVRVPEDLAKIVRRGIVISVKDGWAEAAMGWDVFIWLVKKGFEDEAIKRKVHGLNSSQGD